MLRTCIPHLCCCQYSCVHRGGGRRAEGCHSLLQVWNTEKWSPRETYFLFSSADSLGCGDGRKIIYLSLSWYSSRFVRWIQNFPFYSYFFRNSDRNWILVLVFVVFIELECFLSLYCMISCLKRTAGIDSRSPRSLRTAHYIRLNLLEINFCFVVPHL